MVNSRRVIILGMGVLTVIPLAEGYGAPFDINAFDSPFGDLTPLDPSGGLPPDPAAGAQPFPGLDPFGGGEPFPVGDNEEFPEIPGTSAADIYGMIGDTPASDQPEVVAGIPIFDPTGGTDMPAGNPFGEGLPCFGGACSGGGSPTDVPEPMTAALLGAGAAGGALLRGRRKEHKDL